jgi:N-acetylmuramoyl-L-alanine amidase
MISHKYKSPNFNERNLSSALEYIIIHYTGVKAPFSDICKWFEKSSSKVSSHYVIDYDGKIYSFVDIKYRAWHAGKSYWNGNKDINSASIGIEIHNSGDEDFLKDQLESLIYLIKFLMNECNIKYHNVIGHSDVSVNRKIDPGKRFPWQTLFMEGIGVFSNRDSYNYSRLIPREDHQFFIEDIQQMLKNIGYELNITNKFDDDTIRVIRAFQRHWRSSRVNGLIDISTKDILLDIHSQFNEARVA